MKSMTTLQRFMAWEPAGGLVLCITAVLALLCNNSAYRFLYEGLLDAPMIVQVGSGLKIAKPIILWINDGLMTIFFLLVGLEIKRELLEGELNSLSKVALPLIAAIGGMVVPAAFYSLLNWNDAVAMRGWATPVATDIAFSLGVLSLLGSRVPLAIKVFLTALATFDDLGAIIVIAVRYTNDLSHESLLLAVCAWLVLLLLNRSGVRSLVAYGLAGTVLWVCVLKSGIHATLAGVILAFAIPSSRSNTENASESPAHWLEKSLGPWVTFAVLPVFAFANAGIPLDGLSLGELANPMVLGSAGGLFIGKQIGIFSATWLAVKSGMVPMLRGSNWLGVYGTSLICGIGFTMSFFIGSLAFEEIGSPHTEWIRLGVISGSLLSGIAGYLVLRYSPIHSKET